MNSVSDQVNSITEQELAYALTGAIYGLFIGSKWVLESGDEDSFIDTMTPGMMMFIGSAFGSLAHKAHPLLLSCISCYALGKGILYYKKWRNEREKLNLSKSMTEKIA